MARRGRPRLVCPREPNGRRSRSAAKALERQVQAETRPEGLISPLEVRRFWVKAAGHARLEAFGLPVGQLLLFGKLDEAQYSAARAWAKLAARYRLAIEAPRTPRSVGLERIPSSRRRIRRSRRRGRQGGDRPVPGGARRAPGSGLVG
jgi:hypothetical protein